MPTYVLLSEKNASADGTADRRLACAAERLARSLKPRYDGTAIASRMPMMTMTTRSSMSVKPSLPLRDALPIGQAIFLGKTEGCADSESAADGNGASPVWGIRREIDHPK